MKPGPRSLAAEEKIFLGFQHHQAGRLTEAETLYREALQVEPNNAEVIHFLGVIGLQTGRTTDAIPWLEHAVRLQASNPNFQNDLGLGYLRLGRSVDSEHCFRRAIEIAPDYVDAHNNLGLVSLASGSLESAERSFRKAIALEPGYGTAYINLGGVLRRLGKLDEAREVCNRAVTLSPARAEAHNNLGNVLKELGSPKDAERSYRKAVSLKPSYPEALRSLGLVLRDMGRSDEAERLYRQILAANPHDIETRWCLAMSQLPPVCGAGKDPDACRSAFAEGLAELSTWFAAHPQEDGEKVVGLMQPYYLAYQERSNRELLGTYGNLCSGLMRTWWNRRQLVAPVEVSRERMRVGIVSAHVHSHSVWFALVRGWLEHLDQTRFELELFNLGSKRDAETEWARSRALCIEPAVRTLEQWVNHIAARQPDVLIYPEVGMDSMTIKLAALRLAPTQIAAWGHPETTGLPTIDYYLSAEAFEPESAQEHYTERLIALPHLGCAYPRSSILASKSASTDHGISGSRPLLICPGAPFKYAPEHDRVLVEVARRLKSCRLVFFAFITPGMSTQLHERFRSVFAQSGLNFDDHAVFLPWQDISKFRALMGDAYVMLDTIGFSGFNTVMQAVECGLPIVTKDGRFMRGRLGSGVLRHLALPELVASSEEEYIELVVKLVEDEHYRRDIRRRIEESRSSLYEDIVPIKALEELLSGIHLRNSAT